MTYIYQIFWLGFWLNKFVTDDINLLYENGIDYEKIPQFIKKIFNIFYGINCKAISHKGYIKHILCVRQFSDLKMLHAKSYIDMNSTKLGVNSFLQLKLI